MELVKARQQTDFTCGPAVLDAAMRNMHHSGLTERAIARLSGSTKEQGTTPEMLSWAAKGFFPDSKLIKGMTDSEFDILREDRYLLLLISLGPNYGHWVMSCPTMEDRILIDDPWETESYWSMSVDQLDDCWRWTFPYQPESRRDAIVLPHPGPQDLRRLRTAYFNVKLKHWYLPEINQFPPLWKWSQAAITKYEKTGVLDY